MSRLYPTLAPSVVCLLALAACSDDLVVENTVFTPEQRALVDEHLAVGLADDIPAYTDPARLPLHFSRFGFGKSDDVEHAKIHLGRALFYDTRLSRDNTVSCASCHAQAKGFADDRAFSEGLGGRATERNTQSINNIRAYYGEEGDGFFWDARAASLPAQAAETMANPEEMGMSLADVRARLAANPGYVTFFEVAYAGAGGLTTDNVTDALARFTRNISSTGSRFDRALDAHMREREAASDEPVTFGAELVGGDFTRLDAAVAFTPAENRGKDLYLLNCASCHSTQLPTRLRPANNGLYPTGGYADKGVGDLGERPGRDGWFKTPQLRNVALTAPYMHDGSYATLEEVIDHYSAGIRDHDDLSDELRVATRVVDGERGFHFDEGEKADLLAFLHTLSDFEMATDPRLADPFR